MLRIKGFAPVDGKPMRLVVQGVGQRIAHHFDRPWKAGEARDGRMVVIGLKGFDREGRRSRFARGMTMHLLPVTAISLDEGEEAIDLQQPPGDIVVLSFADSDLGALAAAHRLQGGRTIAAPRLAAPPAPSPLGRSLHREDRGKGALRARALPRRARLLALRHRAPREACRAHGIKLAVLPGDDRPDPRLCRLRHRAASALRRARRLFPGRRHRQHAPPARRSARDRRASPSRRARLRASRGCRVLDDIQPILRSVRLRREELPDAGPARDALRSSSG